MTYTIALAGNPNCGKTTLFNELTGAKQHVGNWPGVTVDKKEGVYRKNREINLMDLPGTYSLSPYSAEEIIAGDYIIKERPDAVIDIVDGTNIERNFYLTVQIAETGIPMVIAMNMMDEVEHRGDRIDCEKLSALLGVPVIPITARTGKGLEKLMEAAIQVAREHKTTGPWEVFDDNIKSDEGDAEAKMADLRYQYIEKLVRQTVKKNRSGHVDTKSNRLDRILTNRILALPIFAAVMYLLFACTFSENFLFLGIPGPGVWLAGLVETGWGQLTDGLAGLLEAAGASPWVFSLVIDGVMEGVGAVAGFLPLVLVLFLLMSFLEDSGYMARVAFVMDRIFRHFGLSGRSFIPMLMGFGCSVPALMASRTLESDKDRKITMMITPFMSCGAKLPIYAMFAAALFAGTNQTLIVFSIYMLGIAVAILAALVLNKFFFKGETSNFVMELPRYRLPTMRSVFIHGWEKVKGFAIKAGTIIFASTVLIWLLSNFNLGGMCDMEDSLLASIGNSIKWIFAPLGFADWRATVGVVTGWIAKENIVATFGQLFGGIGEETLTAVSAGGQALPQIGEVFDKVSAYSYMAFNLLCMPCFAAVGAIRREMGSLKWTLRAVGFQMLTAYIVALLIYGIGSLIF